MKKVKLNAFIFAPANTPPFTVGMKQAEKKPTHQKRNPSALLWGGFINILLFFSFLVSAFSGFVLFLGLARHNWKDIHNISSLVFMALAIVHFILYWNYIKNLPKLFKS